MFVFNIIIILLTILGGCTKKVKKDTYTLFKNSVTTRGSAQNQRGTTNKSNVPLTKRNKKKPSRSTTKAQVPQQASPPTPHEVEVPEKAATIKKGELDFTLANQTNQTLFVTCFSYVKNASSGWHWDKSPVHKLKPHQTVLIDIETIPNANDRKNVSTTLGLFATEQEAENATLRSLDKKTSLHLGAISTFKNKMVVLTAENYGTEHQTFSFYLKSPHDKQNVSDNIEELDFEVQNTTGKTLFVTCFSYIKKQDFSHWRWDKSPVYKLEDNESAIIDIDTIQDPIDRRGVLGYLGIFTTFEEADEATFELLPDAASIDLDLLYKLKNQKVVLTVERYGFKGQNFDFRFKKTTQSDTKAVEELDFLVENQTGKDIYVTCFTYDNKDPATPTPWQFDKTPVIFLAQGQSALIDVATVMAHYDRDLTKAFLAIFDSDEQEAAERSIFQLLKPEQKLALGSLIRQKNKKIVLYVEHYGVAGEIIDYTAQPARKITPGKKIERKTR